MSVVPSLYEPWLSAWLPEPLRSEPEATCDRCPRCEAPRPDEVPFTLDTKCCGYQPKLPNYLAGAVLRDGGPGAETLRARIDAKVSVTPLAVGVPPAYAAAWDHVHRTTGFGSDPSLACPHLHAGSCRIWAHRDAVCSTWFCRFEDGEPGRARWLAVRALLQALETDLSRWAAVELGLDPSRRPMSWGPYRDDRAALYVAAAERVEGLEAGDVRRIGGFGLRVRIREAKASYSGPS